LFTIFLPLRKPAIRLWLAANCWRKQENGERNHKMMQEIENFYLKNLGNGQHLAFHDQLIAYIEKKTATALNIEDAFEAYKQVFARERLAFMPQRKSAFSGGIVAAHRQRGKVYQGLKHVVKAGAFHWDKEKIRAARILLDVLRHFGDVSTKGKLVATSAAFLLASSCKKNYAAELSLLGATEWIDALAEANEQVEGLMAKRNSELAKLPKVRMVDVRPEVDEAYRNIIRRVNALVILQGVEQYAGFIGFANAHIADYRLKLAQHLGRLAKKRRDKEEKERPAVFSETELHAP
jgi:hypothetical protein